MFFFFFFLSAAAQMLVTGCLGAYSDAAFAQSGCEGASQRAFHYPLLSCDSYCSCLLQAISWTRNTLNHITMSV